MRTVPSAEQTIYFSAYGQYTLIEQRHVMARESRAVNVKARPQLKIINADKPTTNGKSGISVKYLS